MSTSNFCMICGATANYRFTKGNNQRCDMCIPLGINKKAKAKLKKHIKPRGKHKYSSIAKRWYAK